MTDFALCHGAGLRICMSCRRNYDNVPVSQIGEHQSWITPAVRDDKCGDWSAIPEQSREDRL